MTVAWPMMTAACLTLALIHLWIALGDGRRAPHLFFASAALAIAAISGMELALLRADDVARYDALLRWASIPLLIMVASVAGFVWSFFGTGRAWIALTGVALNAAAQLANFFSAVPAVRHSVGIRQIETFGGVKVTIATTVAGGPWTLVEIFGVAAVMAFVLDASLALWRRGQGRRAAIVGGGIIFFLLASRGHAILVEKGIVNTPYLVSFSFLGVLIAMGVELGQEVLHAASLARDLHESERRMELAAHAAKLGFWTWNLAQNEIWANETARDLFEIPLSERINLERFVATLHPEDSDRVKSAIQAALAGGIDYEKEYRVVLPSGGERWIAARGRVELGSHGKPMLMRGVLLDITAHRRSEAELQQLRGQLAHAGRVSMMGQLASALAHELNQPLGAILRNAEAAELFMQEDSPNLDEVRAIISDIRKDDQRAGEVIDRLRSLLKRRDIESRMLSVSQLLDEVLALTRADAAARGVKLDLQCDPDLPSVRGDRVHLQQVLINLIINGMDALSESKQTERRVTIRAQRNSKCFVEVSVSDNGHGIPADKLQNVFDPFFTTKTHGMGMGLPISRTIIEAHGGKLTAENGTMGGAVFRFTLPEDDGKDPSSI